MDDPESNPSSIGADKPGDFWVFLHFFSLHFSFVGCVYVFTLISCIFIAHGVIFNLFYKSLSIVILDFCFLLGFGLC